MIRYHNSEKHNCNCEKLQFQKNKKYFFFYYFMTTKEMYQKLHKICSVFTQITEIANDLIIK